MQVETTFTKLAGINCNENIERKNGFIYLSWPWAVKKLRETDPKATWEVKRFDGLPYLKTECGYFVEVAVTVEGVSLSQIHPVLDHRNKPIAQPDSFHINTSIQRALVKAIALHGLGLYIYAGEDLPEGVPAQPAGITPAAAVTEELRPEEWELVNRITAEVRTVLKEEGPTAAMAHLEGYHDLDGAVKVGVWQNFSSADRAAMRGDKRKGKTNGTGLTA